MIDAGDIHLADLNEEVRRRVLVISNVRFHRLSGRVFVVPEILAPPDDVPDPWRIEIADGVYGVDLTRSMPITRVLERVDRAGAGDMVAVRRALRAIT